MVENIRLQERRAPAGEPVPPSCGKTLHERRTFPETRRCARGRVKSAGGESRLARNVVRGRLQRPGHPARGRAGGAWRRKSHRRSACREWRRKTLKTYNQRPKKSRPMRRRKRSIPLIHTALPADPRTKRRHPPPQSSPVLCPRRSAPARKRRRKRLKTFIPRPKTARLPPSAASIASKNHAALEKSKSA